MEDLPVRYYQLVLISVRDAELFARYQTAVAPIARGYGRVERQLVPERVYGEAVPLPDIVNVVYGNSEESFHALSRDRRFAEVVPMRSASIDMSSISGPAERGEVSEDGLADRLYLVELARFGADGECAYRAYEREAGAFMAPFGYHVERVIRPDGEGSGLPFRPDLVKIAYVDGAGALDRMHADPGQARIEGELYAAAVAQSVWFVARAQAVAPAVPS